MKHKSTPDSEFENYLRKELQQVDDTPDDEVWAGIAGQQAGANRRIRLRRYGVYLLLFTLLVSIGGLIYRSGNQTAGNRETTNPAAQPGLINESGQPMAGIPGPESNTATPPEQAHKPAKPFVAPSFGIRSNSVPATTVRFKAETGLTYQSPVTGTIVKIPAGSLADLQGNTVTGEADLYFREYRTIEEFLASGIPMHYSDNRGDYQFNSGGMFEVRVSQNGVPLTMARGKNYNVNFSPTGQLESASLYYLDDKTGKWEFRPDAALGQAGLTEPPVVTESTAIKNNLGGSSNDCMPDPGIISGDPDYTEMVKLGVKTGYELATGKLTMPTWFLKNPYLTDDQLLFRMERGLIQLKKHRDQNQLFFPEDINKFFTELTAFKDCYFTFNADSLGGARNLGKLTQGDYWQRISIAREVGARCIITLYDGKEGQLQFHAMLAGSTENKKFNADKVFAEYDRLRKQRQKDFAEKNRALRYFLYSSSPFKPKDEWCLSFFQWLPYFEQNHPLMARRYGDLVKQGLSTDDALAEKAWKDWQKLLRDQKFDRLESNNPMAKSKNTLDYALHLSDFGVYNYDQIFRLGGEGSIFVNATFKTNKGQRIIPAFVSQLEARTRVFITLPSPSRILYSPGRKLDIIVTDRDGRQYYFSNSRYAAYSFDNRGMNEFTLEDVTDRTNSPRAWAELLEI